MSQNYDPNNPNQGGGYDQQPQGYGAPPPGQQQQGYGAPPPGQQGGYQQTNFQQPDMNKMAANATADLTALPQKWIEVLTKPSTAFFDREIRNANWTAIIVGILIAAVVSAIFSFIRFGSVTGLIGGVIGSFIGLLIGSGILYLVATTVGKGKGDFMVQTYLYSLYVIPLSIASSIVSIIPVLGGLLGLAISIYELYLTYLMLQPAHKMSKQSAQTTVLVLLVIGVVLAIVLGVLLAGALLAVGYRLF